MIALGNLLTTVAGILHIVIYMFYWLIIAHVILSWVSPDPRNPIVQFIYNTTEPILAKVRGKIPAMGMLDLSPILVLLVLYVIDGVIVKTLNDYGHQMIASSAVKTVGF